MTPRQFVDGFAQEKKALLDTYLNQRDTAVGKKIAELRLSPEQRRVLVEILDGALTDAYYGILLALDGAASIGGRQVEYQLQDDEGNILTGGEIEEAAWEVFHGQNG
jgi:hypothetical protein